MKRRFDPTEARQAPSAVAAWVLGADGVRWHLRALAAAAVLLVLVNIAVDPVRLWSLPVVGVWGIVLAVHAGLAGAAAPWLRAAAPVAAKAAGGARTWVVSRKSAAVDGPAVSPAAPSREAATPDGATSPPSGNSAAPAAAPAPPSWNLAAPAPGPVQPDAEHAAAAAPRAMHGPLPDAVAALWGPAVPAASPTMVEHFAGWRWGPATDAAPAPSSFAPPWAAAKARAAAAERDTPAAPAPSYQETIPLAMLPGDAASESSLAGD